MSGNGDEERSGVSLALSPWKLAVIAFLVGTLVGFGALLTIGGGNYKVLQAVKPVELDLELYHSPEMSSKFFAARGQFVFHRFDCELVQKIEWENLLVLDTFLEARHLSLRPCVECLRANH